MIFLLVSPVSLTRRQTREIGARFITWVLFLEGYWELNFTITSGPEDADSRGSGGAEEAAAQLLPTRPHRRTAAPFLRGAWAERAVFFLHWSDRSAVCA